MPGIENLNMVLGHMSDSDEENEDVLYPLPERKHQDSVDEPPIQLRYVDRGWRKYFPSLLHCIPFRSKTSKGHGGVARIDQVGCFSFITYAWVFPFLWSAFRGSISCDNESWTCSTYDSTAVNVKRLEHLWKEELRTATHKRKPSLPRTLVRFIRTRLVIACFVFLLCLGFGFIGPTCLIRVLIAYVETADTNLARGLSLVSALFLVELFRVLSYGASWAISYRTGVRARSAVLGLLFNKLMRTRSLNGKTTGEVINIYANDGQRIFDAVTFAPLVISGFFVLIGGLVYLLVLIGSWSLMGLLVFVIFDVLQVWLGKSIVRYRVLAVKQTEERVSLVTEILCCISLVKAYAWEQTFMDRIHGIRKKEQRFLKKTGIAQSLAIGAGSAVPVVATIVTFLAYIGSYHDILASQAFSIMTVFFVMVFGIRMIPYGMRYCSEALVSLRNIQTYLLLEEVDLQYTPATSKLIAIAIQDASFSWASQDSVRESEVAPLALTSANAGQTDLRRINLTIERKSVIGIAGPVAAGKSSLLQAIIGHMKLQTGNLLIGGKLAYCAQDPWIQNATVRENITFGELFDDQKYYKVLYACNLNQDISAFSAGDKSEIGERGVTLSGGQKARLSLARALYASRDIYLLDSLLNALDNEVAAHVFQYAIKDLLSGKTVILVTNDPQFQYLRQCHEVVFMQSGEITDQGPHNVLLQRCEEYADFCRSVSTKARPKLVQELSEQLDRKSRMSESAFDGPASRQSSSTPAINRQQTSSVYGMYASRESLAAKDSLFDIPSAAHTGIGQEQLVEFEEDLGLADIPFSVYATYIKAAGGACVLLILLATFFLNTFATIFGTVWFSHWLKSSHQYNRQSVFDSQHNTTTVTTNHTSLLEDPNLNWYMTVYSLSLAALICTTVLKSWLFVKITLNASTKLHNQMLHRIMHAPLRFFDSTPVGRIINRFSKDLDEVDTKLPFSGDTFLQNILTIIAYTIVIGYVLPWFLAAAVPLGVVLFVLVACFRSGIRYLKRSENRSRSPLFAHIQASLDGLSTLHAFGQTESFTEKFKHLLDDNSGSMFMFQSAMRWLAVWLDILVVLVTFVTSLLIVLRPEESDLPPAYAGLVLVFAMQMSGIFQFAVRMHAEIEAKMTNVERIKHFANLEQQEAKWYSSTTMPSIDWPAEGRISFRDVKLRYQENLPFALKGVSFEIRPKEKVGIVGRTGAGKSSIAGSLFRLLELESGAIFVDGLDISQIGLHDLRRRMALIPQDPSLFAGTLRFNLDPLNQYTDEQIWQALERTRLKDVVSNMERQLQAQISEGGRNLSVGQRQLLCMTRALLKNVMILVLDEATANVDQQTDAKVQQCLQDVFAASCTLLIIAHRTEIVLNCDRVLLVDSGKVVENDHPEELMKNTKSRFYQMVHAGSAVAGDRTLLSEAANDSG